MKRLESFELTEEEEDTTVVNEEDIYERVKESTNSCIGRIFARKETPMKFLKLAMAKAWRKENLKVIKIKHNMYQIFFQTAEEVAMVINQGPWCLDNNLISLKQWVPQIEEKDDSFNKVKFWVQAVGIPRECCTKEVGRKLANRF